MKSTLAALVLLTVLVISSVAVLSLPQINAQSVSAKVLSYSAYISPNNAVMYYSGDLIVVGEVENTGSSTIGQVYVVASTYDNNSQLTASTENMALEASLGPGQKAPFYIDFDPSSTTFGDNVSVVDQTSYNNWLSSVLYGGNITVAVVNTLPASSTIYSGLTISNPQGSKQGGTYVVTGTLTNTGSQTASDIYVIGTFYNSTGGVIGYNITYVGDSLAAGRATSFTLSPTDDTGSISAATSNYALHVDASVGTAATPLPTPQRTNSGTSGPTNSQQPTSTPPSTNSSGLSPIDTYAIIGAVIAIVAILAAVIMLRKRSAPSNPYGDLPPPPPPPPPPE